MRTASARLAALAVAAVLLAGCAVQSKYAWGNYDGTLYRYYKDPTTLAAHMKELDSIIAEAEKTHAKVAPGLHAEYGYLLLQQGKATEAKAQFEQEKASWPESTQLMTTMIKMADAKAANDSKGTAQ